MTQTDSELSLLEENKKLVIGYTVKLSCISAESTNRAGYKLSHHESEALVKLARGRELSSYCMSSVNPWL